MKIHATTKKEERVDGLFSFSEDFGTIEVTHKFKAIID